MPTTSNFGWTTPADTDLVKDGAAAIRTLGNGIDTSFLDLKGGTTGQVLSKATNTDLDFTWTTVTADITEVNAGVGISGGGTSGAVTITNSMATAIDAKGDLVAGTGADTFSRLAVGTNGQVLTADSTAGTGLAWTTISTSPTFVGCSLYITSAVSISNATTTVIDWTQEKIDTDNFHSTVTNPSRITIPTGKGGKYAVYAQMSIDATSASGYQRVYINVNGSGEASALDPKVSLSSQEQSTSTFGIFNLVAGDYLTMSVFQNTGSAKNLEYAIGKSVFMAYYLGA